MGMATNFIIFMAVLSIIGVQFAGIGQNQKTVLNVIISNLNGGAVPTDFPLYNIMISSAIFSAASLVIGLISYPNPYILFSAFTISLIGTFAIMPYSLFGGANAILPAPFNTILTVIPGFMMMWGILNWFKGGTGEA